MNVTMPSVAKNHSYFLQNFAFIAATLLPSAATVHAGENDLISMYLDDSQMVQVATRYPKPITQTAENVTIITAKDIENMHAHNLSEILETVPGFNVDRYGADFNGLNFLYAHGIKREHILVLVDGQRRNSTFNIQDDLKGFPLAIIDRIEIVRGPASSSWGSSMGGVINIFTKQTGKNTVPFGTVDLSRGENGTGEYNFDMAGKAGKVGYFLYAGRQESDGLKGNRFYDDDRFHAKVSMDLPGNSLLTCTAGLSDPSMRTGEYVYPGVVESEDIGDRTRYVSAFYQTTINRDLTLNFGVRSFERNVTAGYYFMPGTVLAAVGDLGYEVAKNEKNSSISLEGGYRLNDRHQLAFGSELLRSELNSFTIYGEAFQTILLNPPFYHADPAYEQTWGVYLNDTYSFGNWTFTPGVRYDKHSIADDFISPGFGLTYRLSSDVLLRGLVSRGFTYPLLNYFTNGTNHFLGNPDLKPEKVLSWQMGVETTTLEYVFLKASVFLHQTDDTWHLNPDVIWWENGGRTRRHGFELEAETVAWHNLSLAANTTFTHQTTDDPNTSAALDNDASAVNVLFRYDDKVRWLADLRGRYNWLGSGYLSFPLTGEESRMSTVIWDFTLTRRLNSASNRPAEMYTKIRNIFNGANYTDYTIPNPDRWIEVGMKFRF